MKFEKTHLFLAFLVLIASLTMLMSCPSPNPNHHQSLTPSQREMANAVAIFFSKHQGSQSITEEVIRQVPPPVRNNPLKFAVEELLSGPTPEEKDEGYYTEIPKGTKLLGITKTGDTVKIDLSGKFATGGGSTSVTQRLEELKKTALSADTKNKIYLTVEGQPLETLGGEGLEVPQPLKRDLQ
jgi:spore germination protein GerM